MHLTSPSWFLDCGDRPAFILPIPKQMSGIVKTECNYHLLEKVCMKLIQQSCPNQQSQKLNTLFFNSEESQAFIYFR